MNHIPMTWSDQANRELRELRQRIAKDTPRRANEYVRKLREAVSGLRRFPESGAVVEEINDPSIREIPYDRYRVIYRYDGEGVRILSVWPAARPLHARNLES